VKSILPRYAGEAEVSDVRQGEARIGKNGGAARIGQSKSRWMKCLSQGRGWRGGV